MIQDQTHADLRDTRIVLGGLLDIAEWLLRDRARLDTDGLRLLKRIELYRDVLNEENADE